MWNVRKPGTARLPRPPRLPRPQCPGRLSDMLPRPEIFPGSMCGSITAAAGALALGWLFHALPAQAVEFGSGELQGRFDTTLSHGVTFRTGKRKDGLTGLNSDDGGRNYDRGLVSNTSKVTGELELDYRNFGAFARVNGFIDFENENGGRKHRSLTEEAKDLAGKDLEVLDLFVTGAFDAGDTAVDVRLGNHVLNWGESTFIQNGVNVVNPFDVTRLRTPGAELRDALVPVPLVSASVAPTAALSLEGFYQLDWKKTEIDPTGTYFSTNDYVGAGGHRAFFDDPRFSPLLPDDEGGGFGPLARAMNLDFIAAGMNCQATSADFTTFAGAECEPDRGFSRDFLSVAREPDRNPGDSGQWGFALRYLGEDADFGFYFINHHSRLPLVSATYGTEAGFGAGVAAATAISVPNSNTANAIINQAVPAGTPNRDMVIAAITQDINTRRGDPTHELTIPGAAQILASIDGAASALAIDRYGKTASYHIEYPENLQVFGVSFNTSLGASGWALQGEYSFHPDAPLQRTEASLFEEGLRPLTEALQGRSTRELQAKLTPTRLQGYVERDVSQLQVTATKVFGPVAGADSMAFITEAAVMHVHDMPDKNTMPLDTGGIGSDIADATSFGYRAAARLDYNNAVGAARLSPYAQLQHDVSGSSPGPGGPFVDGRKVLTLGLGVSYLESWRGSLGYTMHAGGNNQLSDRDFVTASVSYSF